MTNSSVIVRDFKPLRRNTLAGFAEVIFPSGLTFLDVAIHSRDGKAWAAPASKAMLDREGRALRDERDKIKYSPVVGFASKEVRDRWSKAVLAALVAAYPDALKEGN